jgi:hypothetical protein
MSGNADGSSTDEGEWRIIVEKKRSLWQRLSSKGRIAQNDEMTGLIEEILSGDPTIRDGISLTSVSLVLFVEFLLILR